MKRGFRYFMLSVIFVQLLGGLTAGERHKFSALTNDQGLSASMINCITKDNIGFMWFGTRDGLNRFDGKNIKVFRQRPGDRNSIPSGNVTALLTDKMGRIWIGTYDSGVCVLDPTTEKFKRVFPDKQYPLAFSDRNITCLALDENGDIWAGTAKNNLIYFRSEDLTGMYIPIPAYGKISRSLVISDILVIGNTFWIGTQKSGLIKFNKSSGVKEYFLVNDPEKPGDTFRIINALEACDETHIWIGTHRSYLLKFDTNTGETEQISPPDKLNDFNSWSINDLQRQGKDSLWIATKGEGLQLLRGNLDHSELFSSQEFSGGISYNSLTCLYVDEQEILWVGSNGKGINYFHPGASSFDVYSKTATGDNKLDFQSVRSVFEYHDHLFVGGYNGFDDINTRSGDRKYLLSENAVYTLCMDTLNNQLLIGCEGASLFTYKPETGDVEPRPLFFTDSRGNQKQLKFIYDIVPYDNYRFLVGGGAGVGLLDVRTFRFANFWEYVPETALFEVGAYKTIMVDKTGRVWVGTSGGGVSVYDPENNTFTQIPVSSGNSDFISENILCMSPGKNSNIWAGTDRGLICFDYHNEQTRVYTTSDGLPNDYIYGIVPDHAGNLWLSTNQGICLFNPDKMKVRAFTVENGLPGNEFNTAAWHYGKSGEIYFGGVDGLVSFDPNEMKASFKDHAPVLIRVFIHGLESDLDTILPCKKELVIPVGSNFLTFGIAGFNYLFPDQSYYQYRISRLSDKWINNGQSNSISLVDLKPGRYNLEVRSSSNGLSWTENKRPLQLVILPHIYERVWFKITVFLLLIVVIFAAFQLRIRFFKNQEKKLQVLVNQRTSELEQTNKQLAQEVLTRKRAEEMLREANTTKNKFFSIIAHDLRNPFSSLLGFFDLLTSDWNDFDNDERFDIIKRMSQTTRNTFNLVNNLLEWARLQNNSIKPSMKQIELESVINEVVSLVNGSAQIKSVHLKVDCDAGIRVVGDSLMINTIFRNLFSNAVKYTPRGGQVSFTAESNSQYVVCRIHDNGIGMNQTTISALFNISSAGSQKGTEGEQGTGLGLIITNEMVRMMKGKIRVESEVGSGSTFMVYLPKA